MHSSAASKQPTNDAAAPPISRAASFRGIVRPHPRMHGLNRSKRTPIFDVPYFDPAGCGTELGPSLPLSPLLALKHWTKSDLTRTPADPSTYTEANFGHRFTLAAVSQAFVATFHELQPYRRLSRILYTRHPSLLPWSLHASNQDRNI